MKYLKRLWFSVALIVVAVIFYLIVFTDAWLGEYDDEEWLWFWD